MTAVLLVVSSFAMAAGPVVVIDPGHGGTQNGASSPDGELEKTVALQIAKKVKTALEKEVGATVLLTRDKDALVHLSERVTWANARKPEVFISIHCNSMPTRKLREKTDGLETYFLSASASGEDAKKVAARENAEVATQAKGTSQDTLSFILADLQRSENHADSSRLAYAVHESLIASTGATDRGVQQAPFYVLMGLDAPAILVETGFISHPDEGPKLSDGEYQKMVAAAIAAGVKQFLAQSQLRDGTQGP